MIMRRTCVPLVLLCVAGLGAPTFARGWAQGAGPLYETYLVRLPSRVQAVVAEDFDQDGLVDLVVTQVEARDDPPRRLISFCRQRSASGGFAAEPDQTWSVPSGAVAFACGDFLADPGVEILLSTAREIRAYALAQGRFRKRRHPVLRVKNFFSHAQPDDLPLWMSREDLDADGRDDLVVPVADGYKIFTQREPGALAGGLPLRLDPASRVAEDVSGAVVIEKKMPKFQVMDWNGDSRKDFVFLEEDRCLYFLQDEAGGYPERPSGTIPHGFRQPVVRANRVDVASPTLVDVNRDGAVDLLVSYTSGQIGVFESVHTEILVFWGRAGEPYRERPDQIIVLSGISVEPELVDVNRDGFLDLVVSSLRTDLLDNLMKLLVQHVGVSYYVYPYEPEERGFSDGYGFQRTVDIPVKEIDAGTASIPMIYFDADADGDGRKDMVVFDEQSRLEIRLGYDAGRAWLNPSGLGFYKDAYYEGGPIDSEHAKAPKEVLIRDLNADGRSDFLLKHGGRVEIFLSRKP